MFLKRKRKNRRLPRDYVLEVKLSARQRRQNRWRRLILFLGTTLILFLTLFLTWRGVELLLRRFVFENPTFAIRTLRIETDGVLSTEQIRTWAGVKLGANLLALELSRVERDLKLVPAIESVVVERVLPRTLSLRVTEREPIAQVLFPHLRSGAGGGGDDGGICTLDASGYFMFPVEASQRAVPVAQTNDHLPVITGLPPRDIRPGKQTELIQVHAALALLQAFERSPMAGLVDLKQIDIATPGVLVVKTAQGNELTFGLADFDAPLRRWQVVANYAQRSGKHIESLDLAIANNLPMIWTDASGQTQ